MKVCKNGETVEMTYEEICDDLGFADYIRFVKVNGCGSVSFTCGHREEVAALVKACEDKGYRIAKKMLDALR